MSQLSDLPNKRSRVLIPAQFDFTDRGGTHKDVFHLAHGVVGGSQDTLQVTWSQGNPPPYNSKDRDTGGPFWTRRWGYSREVDGPFMRLADIYPTVDRFTYRAGGRIKSPVLHVPPLLLALWPRYNPESMALSPTFSLEPFLFNWGTKAIALVKPTKSVANAYVAFRELQRDGVPALLGASLWKERNKRFIRGIGGEYLNFQFGWAPLINDLSQFIRAALRYEAIWSQFERDAGKPVRRRFAPDPDVTTSTTVDMGYAYFGGPAYDDGLSCLYDSIVGLPPRQLKITRTVTQQRWFSGAFKYYVPERGSRSKLEKYQYELQKLQKLLGVIPTPDRIWAAEPWTWALDWITNTSAVMGNIVDLQANSLVMPYGYVMEHTKQTVEYVNTGGWYIVNPGVFKPVPDFKMVHTDEVKQRLQASPYGFGLTWNGFSPQQVAILAALGITRGR